MNARLTLSSSFSVAFGLILLYKSMQKLAAADNRYESPVVMVNAAAAESTMPPTIVGRSVAAPINACPAAILVPKY